MADVISDYQKWKLQGEHLKTQAKQAMEARFRELLAEAVSVAEEYRSDFGGTLKPPASVTAFRYKAAAKAKPKKAAPPSAAKPPAPKPSAPAARPEAKEQKPDPKIAGLAKQLAAAKKKLEESKAAGTPTRKLEDRVYELEDALHLASNPI